MEQQAGQAPEQTVLMLFRKDLRLDDNPALLAALQAAKHVVSAAATALRPATCHGQHAQQHHAAATSSSVLSPLHMLRCYMPLDLHSREVQTLFPGAGVHMVSRGRRAVSTRALQQVGTHMRQQ
jgi:hypothetical protein